MGDPIPQVLLLHQVVEYQNTTEGEMEICRRNIHMEGMNFPKLRHELGDNIVTLKASWDKFWVVEKASAELRRKLIFEEGRRELGINLLHGSCLLDHGLQILNSKRAVEFKFDEIYKSVSAFIQHLVAFLNMYEKLHVFSNRTEKFPEVLNDIGEQAEKVVGFLEDLCATIPAQLTNAFCFLTVSKAISESGECLSNCPAALFDAESYRSNFEAHLAKFQNMKWSIYQRFTLVVSSHPPPVILTERPRPISFTFFNLHNIFRGKFTIKVYLVREEMVKEIRSANEIPERIHAITRPQIHTGSSHLQGGSLVHGTIFLKGTTITGGNKRKMHPTSLSDVSIKAAPSYPVEHVEGEWVQDGRKSQCFERTLVVREIEKKPNNDAANIKVALLFVAELPQGQQQKVWTISAPMIVITNGSQNEKAWGSMAWDEMASKRGRQDFEVEPSANWYQIQKMLNGTFECLVGRQLTESHLAYLRTKVVQMAVGTNISITDDTKITRAAIFGGQNIPFWSWFYPTASMMRIGCNFNEIWEKGYIHGFIEDQDARALLNEGLTNCTAQSGTFIVRFSDSSPGSLTFVFVGIDHKIYKMEPLKIWKKNGIEECTSVLLRHLNVRERQHSREIFTHIYPHNIPKQVAFKKFYNWDKKHPSPAFEEKGYVKMCNFVPLPPTPTIPPLPPRPVANTH